MCSLTTILSDWAESTTCHGIRDVHKSRSICGKLLWFILTLSFLLIMSIQLLEVYGSFAKQHWLTTVYEDSSTAIDDFPIITICSYNRLQQSERIARGLTDEHLAYIFDKIPVPQLVSLESVYGNTNKGRKEFLNWKETHNMTTKQIFQTMGLPCSKMIDHIRREDFIAEDCISSFNANFTPVFTVEFGQCHQIAITLTNKIVYAGKTQGLTILLKANLQDYLNFTVSNYMDEGFAVQLQFGSRIVVGQWLTIAPGFHYMFAMKERKTQTKFSTDMFGLRNVLKNYTQIFGSEPLCDLNPKLKYDVKEHYSRQQCLAECSLDNTYNYCHCLPFFDSPNVRMCEAEELAECYLRLQENNATEPSEFCKLSCKEPCFERTVETSITFGRFPPRNQLRNIQTLLASINESMTLEQIREDYVLLDIFYEKLSITVVEWYEPLGFDHLVSNLGGVMSLWAGMSLLTIVQAIIYLFHAFLCGLCPERRAKKKTRKIQPVPPIPAPRNQPFSSTSNG